MRPILKERCNTSEAFLGVDAILIRVLNLITFGAKLRLTRTLHIEYTSMN